MSVRDDGYGGFTVGPSAIAGPEPCVRDPAPFWSRDFVIESPFPALRAVPDRIDPLIVALYGGPGTGKSTTASLLFGALKQDEINAELVHEVAKDMTWEDRTFALSHQPYLMAKQLRNYDRLYGKVDVIVTDTSPLLAAVYIGSDTRMSTQTKANFLSWIRSDWRDRNTLNVFLTRDPNRGYSTAGRRQNEADAAKLDTRIWNMLCADVLPTDRFSVSVDKTDGSYIDRIKQKVYSCLPL